MEPVGDHEAIDDEVSAMHEWRAAQLRRLGIPAAGLSLASSAAGQRRLLAAGRARLG